MTIDIRAKVTCSAGSLISASISDDYIQGTGIIKTSGNCELSGVYSLNPGDKITFNYTKNGTTRTLPRVLRVLSSFADPFRSTTTVELGCKLTYLQDLTDPIKWDAFDDPKNSDRTEEEVAVVTIPIYASSIMDKCLEELGITASSNPLTNAFSISEFDFSNGYLNVLSDLLVSESYCGYLDMNENLVVINLDSEGGSGPLLGSGNIIDIGPIGVGQLPGGTVVVSYSTLKLKSPDGTEIPKDEEQPIPNGEQISNWGEDLSKTESRSQAIIEWTDPTTKEARSRIYPEYNISETTTFYKLNTVKNEDGSTTRKNLVSRRQTVTTGVSVSKGGNIFSDYLNAGLTAFLFPVSSTETETYEYDEFGKQVKMTKETWANAIEEVGRLGIKFVYPSTIDPSIFSPVIINNTTILVKKEVQTSENIGDYSITKTETYASWSQTIHGQQTIARASKALKTADQASEYINSIYSLDLYLIGVNTNTELTGSRGQEAPLPGDIANAKNADSANSDNGFRTESKTELELVSGNASGQRRIEFSLPYAPDDIFESSSTSYIAKASDAPQKANKYGRIQNRMLLGNRSGMNIQAAPESIPSEPFAPIFIQANGVVALYRINGTTWTIDNNGIIVSTDAMFWGTAGTT